MTKRTTRMAVTMACMLAAASATATGAERYPGKPIRLIVPFAPGGGTDIVARALAQKLTDAFKQPVVVDNRAGAGGTVGAEIAERATSDGYTMIVVSGSYATNAAIYKLPYDPVNDITPIALLGETGFLLSLHPGVPIRSVKELVAYAKANPGKLNFGSTGAGGITHLASELFELLAGVKMTHVPYKGTGPAMNDLLGGQIQLMFGSMPAMVPQVKSGRLRGIGVTTKGRNQAVPDIPPIADTVPGYEAVLRYGLWGPKGLPQDIVKQWNDAVNLALRAPDMKDRMATEGLEPLGGTPGQFREVLKADVAKWTKVVKAAGIKIDR